MNKEIEFLPLDYSDFDFNSENYVKIYGRSKEGKRVCVIDKHKANFYVIFKEGIDKDKIEKCVEKIKKIEVENNVRKSCVLNVVLEDKKFLGKSVKTARVFITNQKDSIDFCDKINDLSEVEKSREADVPLITKYIMDSGIKPLRWQKIKGEVLNNSEEIGGIDKSLEVDLVLKLEKAEEMSGEVKFEPKILAYDIEASEFELGKGEILMISLHGENYNKVFTWKHCSIKQDFVTCFKSEEEMLENFVSEIKKQSPDLLVGYFSDGFDLPYIKARCQLHKIPLDLGLDGSQVSFRRGRIATGKIEGIVHVDIFRFIDSVFSQYLQSETLGLNEVASELLGEKKDDFDFARLKKMEEGDWRDFFSYNLKDSVLTYRLARKLWPDMLEFSKIIQETLFDITRDSMATHVENYILHNLNKYNEISEKRPLHNEIESRRAMGKYEGAFVFQPTPGLYENVCFFDFTSMYGSVIVTYNLSLSTFLREKEKNSEEVQLEQGKVYFSKERGFFPKMLEEIIEKRKKYKKEHKANIEDAVMRARSNAYKLLANAAYGYQGFFGARYYCREAAASTAALAKKSILETIDKIQKNGFKIIYSDTDSIAFLQGEKKRDDVLKFLEKLNKDLPGIMELELEDFYKRGLFVAKKTKTKEEKTESGAKKKYALITEKEKIKIRGFETVRRDWCQLARELQNKVLEAILKDGDEKKARKIFEDVIQKLKTRKIDKKEILIRTQLKKPISEYLSISPHVVAAQKMQALGLPVDVGMLLEFFIAETREKKALVREKVKLPDEKGEYNIEYYLNNQILPAVENIFDVFNINVQEISDGTRQKKLF
jgi:DNA polymerase elongation subunit (family B)